jgi:hypothetical protein
MSKEATDQVNGQRAQTSSACFHRSQVKVPQIQMLGTFALFARRAECYIEISTFHNNPGSSIEFPLSGSLGDEILISERGVGPGVLQIGEDCFGKSTPLLSH